VRINSQSGKGGAAFIVAQNLGLEMDKKEQIEFGKEVKKEADKGGRELSQIEIVSLYQSWISSR
jgi:2-isopropylmalate synthase